MVKQISGPGLELGSGDSTGCPMFCKLNPSVKILALEICNQVQKNHSS